MSAYLRRIGNLEDRYRVGERAGLRARIATYTPDQRRRVAWHVLACLPAPERVEILERHLPALLADLEPDRLAAVAREISARLEPAWRSDAVRLRLLRHDLP